MDDFINNLLTGVSDRFATLKSFVSPPQRLNPGAGPWYPNVYATSDAYPTMSWKNFGQQMIRPSMPPAWGRYASPDIFLDPNFMDSQNFKHETVHAAVDRLKGYPLLKDYGQGFARAAQSGIWGAASVDPERSINNALSRLGWYGYSRIPESYRSAPAPIQGEEYLARYFSPNEWDSKQQSYLKSLQDTLMRQTPYRQIGRLTESMMPPGLFNAREELY